MRAPDKKLQLEKSLNGQEWSSSRVPSVLSHRLGKGQGEHGLIAEAVGDSKGTMPGGFQLIIRVTAGSLLRGGLSGTPCGCHAACLPERPCGEKRS
jgi:hypothetical protein